MPSLTPQTHTPASYGLTAPSQYTDPCPFSFLPAFFTSSSNDPLYLFFAHHVYFKLEACFSYSFSFESELLLSFFSVPLYLCLSFCVSLFMYLSICLSLCLPLYLSFLPLFFPSLYLLSLSPSTSLHLSLSLSPSVSLYLACHAVPQLLSHPACAMTGED